MNPGNLYSRVALRDLEDIFVYVTSEAGRETAYAVVQKITRRCELLIDQPGFGIARPDLSTDENSIRSTVIANYICIYRMTESEVEILRVLHGSRDFRPAILLD